MTLRSNIYVALGSNLESAHGSTEETLRKAIKSLNKKGLEVVSESRFYRSPAFPDPSEPEYVNAVIEVATDLGPSDLMTLLHELERDFGRVRQRRWEPRIIDLDIVDYQGLLLEPSEGSALTLPHPRMENRDFVLLPLRDVAPNWVYPGTEVGIEALIEALEGPITAKAIE